MLLTAALSIAVADQGAPQSYEEALHAARTDGTPMMVLVSSQGCPACVALKQKTIEVMKSEGDFEEINLVVVDTDREPELASRIMRGSSIPQMVMYTKAGPKWKRQQLTGFKTPGVVRNMIGKALRFSRQGL